MRLVVLGALLGATTAAAEPSLPSQVQIDGGLSIIGAGYEHPVGDHVAIALEAGVFGTYFLPWFDLGDNAIGGVGGVRGTWFARRGVYVTPYVRAGYASGEHDEIDGSGAVVTAGAFVGYAFGLTQRLDLRVGVGAQYIYIGGDDGFGASTPFGAIDFTVGYRL
jgi:hypothetical protein